MIHLKANSTPTSMGEEIKQSFLKHFPNSYAVSLPDTRPRYGTMDLIFQYALGKDKTEWSNGYFENDPMSSKIIIHGFNEDGTTQPKMEVKNLMNHGLLIKSLPNSNYAFDKIKIWRNFSLPEDKIVPTLDKFFSKLAQTVKENLDRLPEFAKTKV